MKNNTNLQNTLKERGIKALIFDLDNTVFDTDPTILIKRGILLEIVNNFPVENEEPVITAQKISQDVRKVL